MEYAAARQFISSMVAAHYVCFSSAFLFVFSMSHFYYSDKYTDDFYEYRHVIVSSEVRKAIPKGRLLTEVEWRGIGVQQSRGWVHYLLHDPEPHILLFRRPLPETERKY
ncbi:cyclin-dependent kinases regulatory subunit 2-like [Rhopilema esculentum]|uniref:cyclin-dependent kinases regulatory subunit 2-like n=1 Tax=Rhopilema esculentum TaxID=499914 RepID=UPI0031DBCE16